MLRLEFGIGYDSGRQGLVWIWGVEIVDKVGGFCMGRGYEGKMRCFAYKHKKLNKHLCQLKKSLDELAEALGCGKKKCK